MTVASRSIAGVKENIRIEFNFKRVLMCRVAWSIKIYLRTYTKFSVIVIEENGYTNYTGASIQRVTCSHDQEYKIILNHASEVFSAVCHVCESLFAVVRALSPQGEPVLANLV